MLLPLGGKTVLEWVVHRVRLASRCGEIVIATSVLGRDDPIEELCAGAGMHCFRGSDEDVLDRYHGAAQAYAAEVVVRVTSDNPLLDPVLLDAIVAAQLAEGADYVSADGVPLGLAQEAFSAEALDRVWHEATLREEREHVLAAFVTRRAREFKIVMLPPPPGLDLPTWRLTLDTREDFELLEELYESTEGELFDLTSTQIVERVARNPRVLALATRAG